VNEKSRPDMGRLERKRCVLNMEEINKLQEKMQKAYGPVFAYMQEHEEEMKLVMKMAEALHGQQKESGTKDDTKIAEDDEEKPDLYDAVLRIESKIDEAADEKNAEKKEALLKEVLRAAATAISLIPVPPEAGAPAHEVRLFAIAFLLYSLFPSILKIAEQLQAERGH